MMGDPRSPIYFILHITEERRADHRSTANQIVV
jgi:hypothetical protein